MDSCHLNYVAFELRSSTCYDVSQDEKKYFHHSMKPATPKVSPLRECALYHVVPQGNLKASNLFSQADLPP